MVFGRPVLLQSRKVRALAYTGARPFRLIDDLWTGTLQRKKHELPWIRDALRWR